MPSLSFTAILARTHVLRLDLGRGYNPHLYLNLKIYNEGELAAQTLHGQWKIFHPDVRAGLSLPLDRDFLGGCENYTETHRIAESPNWGNRAGIFIKIEVKFCYSVGSATEEKQYRAIYNYDRDHKKMIKEKG
jgi:hypothetical protein